MSEDIGQHLNIDVEVDDKFKAPSKVLHQHRLAKSDNEVKVDADYARENLYDLIDTGKLAVDQMAEIARQSQHPRSYEVLSTMIKQMVEANRDLISLHETKKKLEVDDKENDRVVNNNLFVGSTEELQKLLHDSE